MALPCIIDSTAGGWAIQQDGDRLGGCGPLPAQLLADPFTTRGETVIAALSTSLGAVPFTGHQALLLQMAEDGVDGAVLPVQGAFGACEDVLADAITVARPV